MDWGAVLDAGAFALRELTLFAGVGFLIFGAGDLLVDLIWFGLVLRYRFRPGGKPSLEPLGDSPEPGTLAVFVPAWREAAVIGAMLRHTLTAWGEDDYRIFVGCYPNDPDTAAVVRAIADPHIQLVVGIRPGPTTKADCLNTLWRALLAEEAANATQFKAVILHDAEDVVHSSELKLFTRLVDRFDLVQLPVLPLIDPKRRGVSAHYADEFAESHGKELLVRQALGAGIPSAGVGCALSREAMALLAGPTGLPFDADSLTEDYEVGLRLHALGRPSRFVRLPAGAGGGAVATRGHFPTHWRDAVAQKSRWMVGIALAGWDRLGWQGGAAERWMRLRDRQAPLTGLFLLAAYIVMLATPPLALAAHLAGHRIQLLTPTLVIVMNLASLLLVWRLVMRFGFVTHSYGWREGLRAVPRVIVSNTITILATREAIGRYCRARRTGEAIWGKTSHVFPDRVPAE